MHKLSGWFYQTDGKSCALCLTCGDEAVGRRANDFTRIGKKKKKKKKRIGTFEIISSHYYVLVSSLKFICIAFAWHELPKNDL